MIIQVPPIMSTIASTMVKEIWTLSPISFQHMSLWCLFLDSHPTIQHSNAGVCLSSNTELGISTLHVVIGGLFVCYLTLLIFC